MIQWSHLQIKYVNLFVHRLTFEVISYFVIATFYGHNLPGKAVNYLLYDIFMVTVDVTILIDTKAQF